MKFSQEQVDDTIIPKVDMSNMKKKNKKVGKELVKRTQDLNNNIESIMGKSAKPIEQSIVGENLTATISETNYYARTLNNIFLPKMKNNEYYRLILDYENPELKTFTMDLNRETLKGLAEFINNYFENK